MAQQAIVNGSPAAPPDPGLFSRFFGVLVSPADTFKAIATRPRVAGMLVLITLIFVATATWFLSTEVGQRAWEDEAQLRITRPEQQQVIDRMQPYAVMFGLIPLAAVPAAAVLLAGVLYVVFNALLAGEATFRHVLAVVVHSGAIKAVQQVFITPLNYYQESMGSRTNLAVFFPTLDEGSFVARLLGTLDLFNIWWIVILAIGLGVLYRRKARPIAVGLFIAYAIVAVALVALFAPVES